MTIYLSISFLITTNLSYSRQSTDAYETIKPVILTSAEATTICNKMAGNGDKMAGNGEKMAGNGDILAGNGDIMAGNSATDSTADVTTPPGSPDDSLEGTYLSISIYLSLSIYLYLSIYLSIYIYLSILIYLSYLFIKLYLSISIYL